MFLFSKTPLANLAKSRSLTIVERVSRSTRKVCVLVATCIACIKGFGIKTSAESFMQLGPGQPSAGRPRMDCRVVTSLGVMNVSRLGSRLRRSAQRGPHIPRDLQAAMNVPLIKKNYIIDRLKGMSL